MTVKQLFRCIGYDRVFKIKLLKTSGKEIKQIDISSTPVLNEGTSRKYLFEGEIYDFIYEFQNYKVKSVQHFPEAVNNNLGNCIEIVVTYDSQAAKIAAEKKEHREEAKKAVRKKEKQITKEEAAYRKKRKNRENSFL